MSLSRVSIQALQAATVAPRSPPEAAKVQPRNEALQNEHVPRQNGHHPHYIGAGTPHAAPLGPDTGQRGRNEKRSPLTSVYQGRSKPHDGSWPVALSARKSSPPPRPGKGQRQQSAFPRHDPPYHRSQQVHVERNESPERHQRPADVNVFRTAAQEQRRSAAAQSVDAMSSHQAHRWGTPLSPGAFLERQRGVASQTSASAPQASRHSDDSALNDNPRPSDVISPDPVTYRPSDAISTDAVIYRPSRETIHGHPQAWAGIETIQDTWAQAHPSWVPQRVPPMGHGIAQAAFPMLRPDAVGGGTVLMPALPFALQHNLSPPPPFQMPQYHHVPSSTLPFSPPSRHPSPLFPNRGQPPGLPSSDVASYSEIPVLQPTHQRTLHAPAALPPSNALSPRRHASSAQNESSNSRDMQALMEICRRQAQQVIDSALFACGAGNANTHKLVRGSLRWAGR